jgi:hypothetical protein
MTQKRYLFLDFDGVLHPQLDPYSEASHYIEHFCWSPILEQILDDTDPHGRISIILSTSWGHQLSWEIAKTHLTENLQQRVVGGTTGDPVARGQQIENHALNHKIQDSCWIALDDDSYKWPEAHLDKFVRTDPIVGISCKKTQEILREKLERLLL